MFPGEQVRQCGGVRAVLDVDDELRRHLQAESLRRPPIDPLRPHHRLAACSEPGLVAVRPRAHDLARVAEVARCDVRLGVALEDVLRDDRHHEAVVVELLISRATGEFEDHGVPVDARALQPRVLPEGMLRMRRDLRQVEAVLDVAWSHEPAVTPPDALPDGHDVGRLGLPRPRGRKPRDELILERVVAERRLVGEAHEPGHVVPVLGGIEVVVRRPLVSAHVERLCTRQSEHRRLLGACAGHPEHCHSDQDGQNDERWAGSPAPFGFDHLSVTSSQTS